ncbi:MAG TPA: family 78 glycoside hydrolase catalytic domain [Sedimentisphaerales bacterium]|nr:family 78 glycoside hydrolase catalytic domain [Sedimentisphaerales bacterium]
MNRIKLISAIGIVFLSLSGLGCTEEGAIRKSGKAQFTGATAGNLRCEYLVNPIGIDVIKPRLSWILESEQRSCVQSAYHILVASSVETLQRNKGDLWNSGKIKSDRSNQVAYKGKPLKSRMRCYWKVRVWDKNGRVSAWSEPAMWTAGLLESEDWRAKWIGYDAEPPAVYAQQQASDQLSLKGGKWIWFDEGDPIKNAPISTRFFRNSFEIASDKSIKRARFALLVDNQATLFVNGEEAGQVSGWQSVHMLDVTDKLSAGANTLAIAVANQGDAANPAGLAGKLLVEFETEETMVVSIGSSWKASNVEQDDWQTSGFDDDAWSDAKEIAQMGDSPWGQPSQEGLVLPPPPYLRKSFVVDKPVKRAVVYASALGLYELQINGRRVGGDYFTPGWTDYTKRVYYQSYDVTGLLTQSGNTIGAILADGWYAGYLGFGKKREHYGSEPRLFVQLEIEYADGTRRVVVTDESWKAAYGPIFEADFLMGETYDSRKEVTDWCRYWFDDADWDTVAVKDRIEAEIQAYPGVTVQKILQIDPKEITEPKKDVYVFDMGQNFSGWVRLKATGQAGTKIVLRFAEMLNPDGTIYTTNLRAARCTDTYICKGGGEEVWEPRFTYHGFRYVEVTGYPGKPAIDAIAGVVVHSDTPPAGAFECSNPMVNQLYRNIVWGQRGNFIEVPTDCPQRDERLGWTGDAQIFIRTATYNMDVAAFFTKWLVDLEDAQSPEGAFPDVAPRKVAMGDGTAAWGDAGVICPWTIYEVYGDKRVIEKHFESMKKWISYLKTNSTGLLRPAKGYGDWVSIASNTPKDVIATAYFAYSTRLLSKMAAALGRDDEAKEYEELFGQIKDAFNEAYVSDDARIKGETQTCYLLGLHFDLLASDKRQQAAEHLVERIKAKNWHLSTGFVGLSYLLPTLTETGHLDVAYRLLANDTFPSWGYSIKNGATTIWERWDGWTEEKGFQDPGMNSFNHYAFGSVGRWLFNTVAGIDTDGPGYKQIIIRPMPGGITSAKASYDSINGKIVSDWRLEDGTFTLNVTIPANTTATVYMPAESAGGITESGRPATKAKGVQFLRIKQGKAVFAVGSGHYEFESMMP